MKATYSAFPPTLAMAVGILIASLAAGGAAKADPAGDTTDPVTGYHCVSQGCFSVRPPDSDCICVKSGSDHDANKIVLDCSTKEDGRWVACPIKPHRVMSVR
ncbi:MAG: hypothetical protein ACTHLP_00640 [Rhizobiaceae bacterium]